ncbi:MAG TPA: hypothetical protein VHC69_20925 [Polyangiaceae bacterium]|nr:hypothetical protein [Polyangiaceae bacterium]
MYIRPTARWLLLSGSILGAACGRDISLGENEGHSAQNAGSKKGGSSGAAATEAPDATTRGTASAGGSSATTSSSGGSGGSTGAGSASGSATGAADSTADASTVGACDDGDAVDLVSDDWTLEPGQELTECALTTATADLDLTTLRLEAPSAVEASLHLSSAGDAGSDGELCEGMSGSVVFSIGPEAQSGGGLFAGVTLPVGKAIHIERGQRLALQTRVANTSADPLSSLFVVRSVSGDGQLEPQPLPVTLQNQAACDPFLLLVQASWSVQPGAEAAYCARKTLASAIDFNLLRVDTPAGTHDYSLSVGAPSGRDGVGECDLNTPEQSKLIVASPDGTSAVYGPSDLETQHADAGEQVLLKVHVVNTTASLLDGTTRASRL